MTRAQHSLVVRLTDGGGAAIEAWSTRVLGDREDPRARDRVRREASRPLATDGPALRAVLLRYATGDGDLVLVADREAVPRAELARLAGAQPASPVRLVAAYGSAPVGWGMGDPGRSGQVGVRELALPGRIDDGRIAAALARTAALFAGCRPATDGETDIALLTWPEADGREYLPSLAPENPLVVEVMRRPDGTVRGRCRYDEGIVAPDLAEEFAACLEHLVRTPGADLPPPGPQPEPVALPGPDRRIDEVFAEVVARQPDALAVGELTYRGLDERAEAVAGALRARGAGPGSRVGVCLDRDATLVVALLGVLKAGCAYVPMDFTYPADRYRYIVDDARLALVLGRPGHFPADTGAEVIHPDEAVAENAPAGEVRGVPGDAAYVIYTSGSTGRPKGVVNPHRNVVALIRATAAGFGLGPGDTWTMFHSAAFDFSVWEVWGCLLTGGRLVVPSYWDTRDAERFHRLLADERVTVLNQTPSAFAQLLTADVQGAPALAIRLLIFGGETLDPRILRRWFTRHPASHCRVGNMYGITETTVHVTARTVNPADTVSGGRSVGKALPGWSVSVRDGHGRRVPAGARGEIYVGGAGVADGYLNRPDLTAQRFVTDPETGQRWYRSGDLGRLRADGGLDHLGRIDDQVKIRGHRIEPAEIRAVLSGHPDVRSAAVVVRNPTPDDPTGARIDAYIVAAPAADPRRILAEARRILPDHMVPATLTAVDAIPLTTNGKPDLRRLPAPGAGAPATGRHRETGDLPSVVLSVWERHLGARVSAGDNFFELGGNSLLVVRVLAALHDHGLPRVAPRDFYAHSTADDFIAYLEKLGAG